MFVNSVLTTGISQACLADVPQLNALVNTAYRGPASKKGWTTEADLLDGLRIDEATLTAYIEDANSFILKYTNHAGGITACVYLNVSSNKLYIGMLTVNPALQNTGIGKLLLTAAENLARQKHCHTLWMTVITIRHELIAYYERKGFVVTGEKRPFPTETKFGIPKQPLELLVMEKAVI
ncbi:acetyltransferase (GNAT) family protein [Mucilaginibacter gracilis]|uniref:Acetyltransferase (GNAT) family protein n=1 Tax=Mucilaginibacter gracilis TaxID=423350 RepID=A0A495J9W8_9SPHI|nr:GNAT family N-acetyltransferase [Mucilaginibacter gracilis]RKR85491.1 acetyltransferase (GNAT) family protein [Mucilaginibacter gracilis]